MKPFRIYVDTSVVGGCLDKEFAEDSGRVLQLAEQGVLTLMVSDVVTAELEGAPQEVRALLERIPVAAIEYVPLSLQAEALRNAYIAAGVVGAKSLDDAMHVALATIARADAIVSWNMKHIVRLDRIRGYNEVNRRLGHPALTIITPREVGYGEDAEN